MFRFLILLLAACACATAGAQTLPPDSLGSNPDVRRFYAGCLKIAEAETTADAALRNSAYAAAMDLLNTRTTRSGRGLRLARMPLALTDSAGLVSVGPADGFAYDYAYARARYRAIDFAPTGVSRGGMTGCRVFDMVLAPGACVSGREKVRGTCVLVAIAQPGGSVQVSVDGASATPLVGRPYEGGLVSFLSWQEPDTREVTYTVRNTSAKTIAVTLAAN